MTYIRHFIYNRSRKTKKILMIVDIRKLFDFLKDSRKQNNQRAKYLQLHIPRYNLH